MSLDDYFKIFQTEKSDAKFFENGLIGYINYDAVEHFENINFQEKENDIKIPEIFYAFYSNIIIINVFNNEALLLHHSFNQKNNLNEIEELLKSNKISKFDFHKSGNITSNLKDERIC